VSARANISGIGRLIQFGSWAWPRILPLGRQIWVGALSGLIAGIIVGGIGSRVAMRISAVAGGESISGLKTENGNIVGDITLGGTLTLLVLGAMLGVFGGLLYTVVRRWLPGSQWWKGLLFGVLLLLVFGSHIIEGDNFDFSRFGPPLLNIGLFASLFILYGLAVAPIAEWCDRYFPASSDHRTAILIAYSVLALGALLSFAAIVGLIVSSAPFAPLFLLLFGLAAIPVVAWPYRSILALSHRPVPAVIGYIFIAVPCLLGLVMVVRDISEIL